MSNKIAILELSRTGDIINILPLAKYLHDRGSEIDIIVHKDYAAVLECVGYAKPVIAPVTQLNNVKAALDWVKTSCKYNEILCSKVDQNPDERRLCSNFAEEAYRLAGYRQLYGKLQLVFDKRNYARELELVSTINWSKPVIAYNFTSVSSPFNQGRELLAILMQNNFDCHFVNTSRMGCLNIADCLAVLDRAALFITVDTATMHLAKASPVTVIDLVNDNSWYASSSGNNCALRVRYSDIFNRESEIIETISMALRTGPKIWHAVNTFTGRGDTERRNVMATKTWQIMYDSGVKPAHLNDAHVTRSSMDIGDSRKVPFIKDVIDAAVDVASFNDIVILTNADTCVSEAAIEQIKNKCNRFNCCYSHRWDFKLVDHIMSPEEIGKGMWYIGADLFAFTVKWWNRMKSSYPDMLIGYEYWDCLLRLTMTQAWPGEDLTLDRAIYHEKHGSYWEQSSNRISATGQVYNRSLAKKWFLDNGYRSEAAAITDNFSYELIKAIKPVKIPRRPVHAPNPDDRVFRPSPEDKIFRQLAIKSDSKSLVMRPNMIRPSPGQTVNRAHLLRSK